MPRDDDNALHFRMPENYLWAGNIMVTLLCLLEFILLWLTFLYPHTRAIQQILYRLLLIPPLLMASTLSLFSMTEVKIDFTKRTYRVVRHWPWGTRNRWGSLEDFGAVHVTEQGYVSLVGKEPGPRQFSPFRQVIALGNAGLGEDGGRFAQEVARRSALKVVTKL